MNIKKIVCRICGGSKVDIIIKLADIPLPEVYEKSSINAIKLRVPDPVIPLI